MSITNFDQVFAARHDSHMIRIYRGSGYHVGYVDGRRTTGYLTAFAPCLDWCREVAASK